MSILRARGARLQRPLGLVLYNGPSSLDGELIVVIATGFRRSTANPKTGDMIQTWILRSDVAPFSAIHSGGDESICGSCPLRGILEASDGQYPTVTPALRNRDVRPPNGSAARHVRRGRSLWASSSPMGLSRRTWRTTSETAHVWYGRRIAG